ncbi:MAG: hydroxymethylpyrimidine/phosphomethylpyrimidine kinase [Gammaproteobacteria bacterium]
MNPQTRAAAAETPLVLVIGGHDPSGAGLQADIETAAALGCHAASLVSCLTTQNTGRVAEVIPTAGSTLLAQFGLLVADWPGIAACKIGLVPTVDVVHALAALLRRLPAGTPVVLDPVVAAGSGAELMSAAVRRALLAELWPFATLRTPNREEAAALAAVAGASDTAAWRRSQAGWVLVKGADATTPEVIHELDRDGQLHTRSRWRRLPGQFHGTGCTLATAIACELARGMPVADACAAGLDYTWRCLLDPLDFGGAQQLPRRLPRSAP